jgi:hypothetical protein
VASGAGGARRCSLQGTGEIEEYSARVPVKKGVHVALDAPSSSAVYTQGGDKFTYLYAPQLALGQAPRASTGEPTGQLLVQAVIEPDADKDGYGDETQDACPANARRHAAPCTDTVRPKLSGLKADRPGHRGQQPARDQAALRGAPARPGQLPPGAGGQGRRRQQVDPEADRLQDQGVATSRTQRATDGVPERSSTNSM